MPGALSAFLGERRSQATDRPAAPDGAITCPCRVAAVLLAALESNLILKRGCTRARRRTSWSPLPILRRASPSRWPPALQTGRVFRTQALSTGPTIPVSSDQGPEMAHRSLQGRRKPKSPAFEPILSVPSTSNPKSDQPHIPRWPVSSDQQPNLIRTSGGQSATWHRSRTDDSVRKPIRACRRRHFCSSVTRIVIRPSQSS